MAIDTAQFRKTCGQFATGVTIVTAQCDECTHGMTANAFISVSLDPPMVLVSVGKNSRMHKVLSQSERYGVTVLAERQQRLSDYFAGRIVDGLEVAFTDCGGVPLIDGGIAWLTVRITDAHPAGDHTLFIGEVEHMESRDDRPLIFHCGKYKQLHRDDVREIPVLPDRPQTTVLPEVPE